MTNGREHAPRVQRTTRDIDVTGLGKRYGAVQVLHDVSFSLRDGEFLTLLGPSGSGKTTTLGIIAGFVEPDYGDVRVANQSILALEPRQRPASRRAQGLPAPRRRAQVRGWRALPGRQPGGTPTPIFNRAEIDARFLNNEQSIRDIAASAL